MRATQEQLEKALESADMRVAAAPGRSWVQGLRIRSLGLSKTLTPKALNPASPQAHDAL